MKYFLCIIFLLFPSFVSAQVVINEIVSDPQEGAEWVELYNGYEHDISLQQWQIVEGSGKKILLNGMLKSHEYLVFDVKSLNNPGDIILIYDACGQLVDRVSYGNFDDGDVEDNVKAPKKGESIIRVDNSYLITQDISKGFSNPLGQKSQNGTPLSKILPGILSQLEMSKSAHVSNDNSFSQPISPEKISQSIKSADQILSIKEKPKGDEVIIVGIATSDVHEIDDQIFYVQQEEQGIQIYLSTKIKEEIAIQRGDLLQIQGKISSSGGEKKINVDKKEYIDFLGKGEEVRAKEITISEIEESDIGLLITLSGSFMYKNRTLSLIDSEEQILKVKLAKQADLEIDDISQEKEVMVTGILRGTIDAPMLFIRDQYDIQLVKIENIQENEIISTSFQATKQSRSYIWMYILWGSIALVVLGIVIFFKYRYLFSFPQQEVVEFENLQKFQ